MSNKTEGQPELTPELTIEELLCDPMIRTVMQADRVDEVELRKLLNRLRRQQFGARKSETIGACI